MHGTPSNLLPRNPKGSIIVITTRIQGISFLLEADGLTCFLHQLNRLPAKAAIEPFCRNAFRWTRDHKACAHELTELCKNLVDKAGVTTCNCITRKPNVYYQAKDGAVMQGAKTQELTSNTGGDAVSEVPEFKRNHGPETTEDIFETNQPAGS
ncbi:hypothetical protein EJ110_NYTH53171 [Nymphaea thermarum]|nr:hypothetical protein EJ110_NYTH53171 [Nymphaea thermarum]